MHKITIITLGALMAMMAANAMADVYVSGYVKSNGTIVSPYVRGDADGIEWNNKR